ncbi:MAG: hypothetical protein COT00_04335 [Candidatus Omnitrophica bacterium CG07_land_8_20_14_0_80_50_8]|nr:MAG: hypothetical protein COT00_04335 [Candidatus Omnitrophica bacterium CG07_land_8_20_14_0_80_50_8]
MVNRTLERVKAHREYCENLLIDELTGLNNRKGFITLSEQQLRIVSRTKKGLVFFDVKITNLNKINQDFDFKEGNRVLVQAAVILKASFRKTDILSRYKGDQFTVCAIDSLKSNIDLMAKRFLTNLKLYNDNMPDYYKIKVRIGAISVGADNLLPVEDIIQLAAENIVK